MRLTKRLVQKVRPTFRTLVPPTRHAFPVALVILGLSLGTAAIALHWDDLAYEEVVEESTIFGMALEMTVVQHLSESDCTAGECVRAYLKKKFPLLPGPDLKSISPARAAEIKKNLPPPRPPPYDPSLKRVFAPGPDPEKPVTSPPPFDFDSEAAGDLKQRLSGTRSGASRVGRVERTSR